MANYTTENLTPAIPIPGVPAIRIGDQVFTMAAGGTDVSDTTATSATVLSGYDFYNASGVKTTGTIPTVNSSSYTPGTSDQVISAGVYLGGSQTILGDANLVGSNIVSGKSIFGVSGTHSCDDIILGIVDSAGNFQPLSFSGKTAEASGSQIQLDYYKTWNTPIPGMILYIPFASSSATAETGQYLDFGGTGFSYSTVDGIPCCYFSGAGYVDVNLGGTGGMPTEDLSISYWVKFSGSEWGIIYTQPGLNTGAGETALTFGNYTAWGCNASANTAIWHHFAVTRKKNNIINVYLDGTLANSDTHGMTVYGYLCRLGAHNDFTDAYPFVGYLAGLRVFNRVISADEITALASEFTPIV